MSGALSDLELRVFSKICPGVHLQLPDDFRPDGKQIHSEWGPVHFVRTGWATDTEIRFRGSSGGGISALLVFLVESGRADFVAHVAVSPNDPLLNVRRISRTRAEILTGAGSRYAPAAPLEDIESLFASGERFAFVGKPCDVAALRAFIHVQPERASQVVAMVSFMCAGVPSLVGTHEVLAALGTEAKELVRFNYRGNGWPGFATAVTRDGLELTMDYNSSWGKILGKHLQLRCKLCPDGTGEFADVVCADAWYGASGYPDFTEREGRSLILSRTTLGEEIVSAAILAGALYVEESSVAEVALMQPYQLTRKRVVLGRLFALFLRRGVWPRFKGLRLLKCATRGGWLPVLRNMWGTYRRLGRGV
ncbi:MAG: Coenzyme F420 hydrogenase/dehydrogenase, beta subunit C-terminal domain [Thiobacillus sp.]|nr:Coenzyme F420 hydrogenase/dehydrogenase, beta subunit C-terminal domain [Thiobacillus sp.]